MSLLFEYKSDGMQYKNVKYVDYIGKIEKYMILFKNLYQKEISQSLGGQIGKYLAIIQK